MPLCLALSAIVMKAYHVNAEFAALKCRQVMAQSQRAADRSFFRSEARRA
jgi:hypothetical protein